MHASIWVIDHKANLNEDSPMNMDGSEWLLGVCVLAAPERQTAERKFQEFLDREGMKLEEIYSFDVYEDNDFSDDSRRSRQISRAATTVNEDGETCYVFARTSEALKDAGESPNG